MTTAIPDDPVLVSNIISKGQRLLLSHAVMFEDVTRDPNTHRLISVRATVRGDTGDRTVTYEAGTGQGWRCDCPTPPPQVCSHLYAVTLVTEDNR